MEFIKPGFEIIDDLDGKTIIKKIEKCGRICYKSEDRITEDSAEKFIRGLVKSGHESVLEHASVTVKFIISRAIANEIVRHRIASYSQESTRYCNYKGGIKVVAPKNCEVDEGYRKICETSEAQYKKMITQIFKAEIARGILPNDLKTELVMTANLREWRHFFKLRCDSHAHPELRRVTIPLLEEFYRQIPVVFEDLWEVFCHESK